jgi:hypothetical protein
MKVKSKVIAFLILLLCLGLSSSVLVVASPGSNTVTLNLHKDSSVGVVNTKSTAGQIFNTTASWSGATQENSSEVAAAGVWSVYFYLYPTLAGTLTFNGIMTVIPFIKANDTVVDVTLITTLNKISVAGASTLISTKTNASSVALDLAYAEQPSPHSSISTTVASGFTLELNITLADSASNLNYSVGYDTAAVNSRITLVAEDVVTTSLSSDFQTYERDDAACLTATVTDVFGGYDIASSTVLFANPLGLGYTLAASSYGDTQYSNTYVYTISKLSVVGQAGTWTPTGTTTDRSGNSFTSSYSFIVTTEPGARNWDPDLPPLSFTGTPSGDASVVVVVIVAICGLLLWYGTKKPKRRR